MFVLFFRASLFAQLFLNIHRVRILKRPTGKGTVTNWSMILAMVLVSLFLLITTVLLYTDSDLAWNAAAQIAWPKAEDKPYWHAQLIILGLDSGIAVAGIMITTAMIIQRIKSFVTTSTVQNSDKIKRSAATVMLLTTNTLLLYITWFLTSVAIKVITSSDDDDENTLLTNETKRLWKVYVLWLPSLLNSIFTPSILIVRNNISVKIILNSIKQSE